MFNEMADLGRLVWSGVPRVDFYALGPSTAAKIGNFVSSLQY
jgi:hypothetical protein